MNATFVNPFRIALLKVFETMTHISLKPEKPAIKKHDMAHGDITGLILMRGRQASGSCSLTFESGLALEVLVRLLGTQAGNGWSTQETLDMVGEITNIVTGHAKKLLAEQGYAFDMAVPVMIAGKRHTIAHPAAGPTILMPFFSAWGRVYIEVCFDR